MKVSVIKELGMQMELVREISKRNLKSMGHVARHSKTNGMATVTVIRGKVGRKRKQERRSLSYLSNRKKHHKGEHA